MENIFIKYQSDVAQNPLFFLRQLAAQECVNCYVAASPSVRFTYS